MKPCVNKIHRQFGMIEPLNNTGMLRPNADGPAGTQTTFPARPRPRCEPMPWACSAFGAEPRWVSVLGTRGPKGEFH